MSDMQCPYCGADQEVCHDDKADMTIKLPPMPEPDHKFVDLEGEAPDIHVWNQASLEAYASEAVRLNMAPLSDEQILEFVKKAPALDTAEAEWLHVARAIEAAHGIKGD